MMNITLGDILKRIETADDFEINEIIEAVRKRFSVAFPDWEVIYLSCPKNNPAERQRIIESLIRYFRTDT